MRKVKPYYFEYKSFAKGRWFDRTILEVFSSEFRDRSIDYYVNGGTKMKRGLKLTIKSSNMPLNEDYWRLMISKWQSSTWSRTVTPLDTRFIVMNLLVQIKPSKLFMKTRIYLSLINQEVSPFILQEDIDIIQLFMSWKRNWISQSYFVSRKCLHFNQGLTRYVSL